MFARGEGFGGCGRWPNRPTRPLISSDEANRSRRLSTPPHRLHGITRINLCPVGSGHSDSPPPPPPHHDISDLQITVFDVHSTSFLYG